MWRAAYRSWKRKGLLKSSAREIKEELRWNQVRKAVAAAARGGAAAGDRIYTTVTRKMDRRPPAPAAE